MSNPDPPADHREDSAESTRDSDPAAIKPRVINTDELFAGAREVWIQHGDQQYRLRITAAGKLILTK